MPKKKLLLRDRIILSEVEDWAPEFQEYFWYLVNEKKNSYALAKMLTTKKAPGLMTDSVFMTGQRRLSQYSDEERERICAAARKQGYSPKPSDAYMPGMADKMGDPKAFINVDNARSQIRNQAIEKGTNVDMLGVKVKGHVDPDRDPREHGKRLNKKIVAKHLKRKLEEDPGLLERRSVQDVQEEIIDKHARRPVKPN